MKQCFLVLALALLLPAIASSDTYNQWTITPLAPGSEGTIHVAISVTVALDGSCLPGTCIPQDSPQASLTLTPCALARACSGGTYQKTYSCSYDTHVATDTLSLLTGVQYTFNGSWGQSLVCFGYTSGCSGSFTPTLFLDNPVPARPTSWGKLKVLYR